MANCEEPIILRACVLWFSLSELSFVSAVHLISTWLTFSSVSRFCCINNGGFFCCLSLTLEVVDLMKQ